MSMKQRLYNALRARGAGTLPELLPYDYDDAQRRVAAHTLEREGKIERRGMRLVGGRYARVWAAKDVAQVNLVSSIGVRLVA